MGYTRHWRSYRSTIFERRNIKTMEKYSLFFNKVYAASITWPTTKIGSLGDIINAVLPILYSIVGLALFGYFIYGGFTWLMSAGDPDKVKQAQDTMFNAAIGTAIVVFAYFATRVVGAILGLKIF